MLAERGSEPAHLMEQRVRPKGVFVIVGLHPDPDLIATILQVLTVL